MERQLKALIWQRLAGMFLIDELHHKPVPGENKEQHPASNTRKLSSVHRSIYRHDRMNILHVCEVMRMLFFQRVQFAEGSDGNTHTHTHTHLALKHQHRYSEPLTGQNYRWRLGAETPRNKAKKVCSILATAQREPAWPWSICLHTEAPGPTVTTVWMYLPRSHTVKDTVGEGYSVDMRMYSPPSLHRCTPEQMQQETQYREAHSLTPFMCLMRTR